MISCEQGRKQTRGHHAMCQFQVVQWCSTEMKGAGGRLHWQDLVCGLIPLLTTPGFHLYLAQTLQCVKHRCHLIHIYPKGPCLTQDSRDCSYNFHKNVCVDGVKFFTGNVEKEGGLQGWAEQHRGWFIGRKFELCKLYSFRKYVKNLQVVEKFPPGNFVELPQEIMQRAVIKIWAPAECISSVF